jgi:hypothetical protein
MLETSLRETGRALETVSIDSRSRRDVPRQERDYRAGLKSGDHVHADTPGGIAAFLHGRQNRSGSPSFALPATSKAGLFAANPCVINLHLAV